MNAAEGKPATAEEDASGKATDSIGPAEGRPSAALAACSKAVARLPEDPPEAPEEDDTCDTSDTPSKPSATSLITPSESRPAPEHDSSAGWTALVEDRPDARPLPWSELPEQLGELLDELQLER